MCERINICAKSVFIYSVIRPFLTERYRNWSSKAGTLRQKVTFCGYGVRSKKTCKLSENSSRPCSPTLGQVDWFSWTETFPLSQPVPPNLKTPLSLSHLSHEDLKTPLSLSHLSHVLQPVPTCPIWLSHSSFPNSLFLDHFLGFSLSFHFSKVRKTLLTEIFSSKYYHVGESKQLTNFQEKIGDNRDNTLEHMSMFCLEFNSSTLWHINTLNKLCLKVHTLYVSLTHCHIPRRGSHHTPFRDISHESGTPKPWAGSASLTSLADMDLGDISSGCTKWRKFTRAHNWAW